MIKHEACSYREKQLILTAIQKGELVTVIPSYIDHLTCCTLTLAGKLELLAYPQEAIQSASSSLSGCHERNFPRLITLAAQWCTRNNILPDTKWVTTLLSLFGITINTPRCAAPPQLVRNYVYYGGRKVVILTDGEAKQRRHDFISRPEILQGIENLARLIGKEAAQDYFNRVYENLKYIEIENNERVVS